MAKLDVSNITTCVGFSDSFDVRRQPEQISQHGRTMISPAVRATMRLRASFFDGIVALADFLRALDTMSRVPGTRRGAPQSTPARLG